MPKDAVVERWYRLWDNPMKPVALAMRDIILAADPRIEEQLKWQAPTFVFQGSLATFFPGAKKHASLMFHLGAKIPGRFPRLVGTGDTSRAMKIATVEDAEAAREELTAIVRSWCKWRLAESVAPPPRTPVKSAAGGTAAKKPSTPKPPRRAP
ncbi:MAG: DUF1801 domain-containing protein [Deltaproteobacteria bacterium]|nr:DUF1801 domain-containing protein [Deltaproteobacteria bacterium]